MELPIKAPSFTKGSHSVLIFYLDPMAISTSAPVRSSAVFWMRQQSKKLMLLQKESLPVKPMVNIRTMELEVSPLIRPHRNGWRLVSVKILVLITHFLAVMERRSLAATRVDRHTAAAQTEQSCPGNPLVIGMPLGCPTTWMATFSQPTTTPTPHRRIVCCTSSRVLTSAMSTDTADRDSTRLYVGSAKIPAHLE